MNRDQWKVQYAGKALLEAAQKKLTFHGNRKNWWLEKKNALITQIKAEGVTVTESVVDELMKIGYSSNAAHGGPVVQVDAGMVSQLREATEKVHIHSEKMSGYTAWIQMLERHGEQTFELDNEDWMYFFETYPGGFTESKPQTGN